jgi:hypothetical protein
LVMAFAGAANELVHDDADAERSAAAATATAGGAPRHSRAR